jgi:Ca2+-binding EF-hand superfamily protein
MTVCVELAEQLRVKLQYEWKNIYRQLNQQDSAEKGLVQRRAFEDAIRATGVFVSNEDLRYMQDTFGDTNNNIQYDKMSKDIGLHQ